MSKKIIFLGLILSAVFLTGFVKEAADIFAGLGAITETISDVNDVIVEEELITEQINTFNEQQNDIQNSLHELDYTESEIHEILGVSRGTDDSNTLFVLRRAAQNIKRAKSLIERLKVIGKINPDVATAGYSAMSAKSLTDIKLLLSQVIYNQNRDYHDRILERASEKRIEERRRRALHEESVAVRTGKKVILKEDLKNFPVKNNSDSISNRFKNWWQNGKSN